MHHLLGPEVLAHLWERLPCTITEDCVRISIILVHFTLLGISRLELSSTEELHQLFSVIFG